MRGRRLLVSVGLVGIMAVTAAITWWAARAVLLAERSDSEVAVPPSYTVIEGELSRSIRLSAVAEWPAEATLSIRSHGTVTSVAADPVATVGSVIIEVDERPVVAGVGNIPAYRVMSYGSRGEDVRQLQILLADLGHFARSPDGVFGGTTRVGVMAWQRELGLAADGVVRLGDIVWFPRLPARVAAQDGVAVGSVVAGDAAIRVLAEAPVVRITTNPAQRREIPDGAVVSLSSGDIQWAGIVAGTTLRPDGVVEILVESADGTPVCGDECARWIPAGGRLDMLADVEVLAPISGPVVPVSAVTSHPDGTVSVTSTTGVRFEVEVVASQGGLLLVEGVPAGTELLLFGDGP